MLSRQTKGKPFSRYGCAHFEIALFPKPDPIKKGRLKLFRRPLL
ncbi:hypothetical protein [Neisseria sp. GT4A_CT1]|nr:hypothetical protein [Neisseria sp. GT4A_CT1]MDU1534878.1 hypothetical protein [Neisseria sp.]